MGTPAFAEVSLRRLLEAGFSVTGVFTQPDKPKDRGLKLSHSPVKQLALEAGLPVFQPERLRDGTALDTLRSLNPELVAVVAYGRIIPDALLGVPPRGTVNIHGSLLPKYRGAAPVQHAVLNGDKTTGVCSMYLASGLDCGDLIHSEETEIGEFETAGELLGRLSKMGAELLVRTVRDIEAGVAPRTPQDCGGVSYAPPISRELRPIDWSGTPRQVVKHICGLLPWPGATAKLGGHVFKIFAAEYTDNKTDRPAGTIVSADFKRGLEVVCGNGETLRITQLQAPGNRRMSAADFLRGHPISLN
jgi:methionyl-tRNA formyltransferase